MRSILPERMREPAVIAGLALVALLASPAATRADDPALPERIFRDIDGRPLPFQTDAEVEDFLRTAVVTAQRDIGVGVTKPKQLVLEKDGLRVHAAFNYVDRQGTRERLADGTLEMHFLDSYKADIASYRLSRLLGLRMIPPGVERKIDGQPGVVRLWVENLESYRDWLGAGNSGLPDSLFLRRQMKDQATFDLLIRNTDRNQGNINWDPDQNLWMIDQTRSFARSPELRKQDLASFGGCSRELYEAMKALDAAEVKRELGPYVGTFEIKTLLKRRDQLIGLIDSQIEQRGEDEILFSYTDPPRGLVIRHDDGASRPESSRPHRHRR